MKWWDIVGHGWNENDRQAYKLITGSESRGCILSLQGKKYAILIIPNWQKPSKSLIVKEVIE